MKQLLDGAWQSGLQRDSNDEPYDHGQKLKEMSSSERKNKLSGAGDSLEGLAIGSYLDDDEWEASQPQGSRSPMRDFPPHLKAKRTIK